MKKWDKEVISKNSLNKMIRLRNNISKERVIINNGVMHTIIMGYILIHLSMDFDYYNLFSLFRHTLRFIFA